VEFVPRAPPLISMCQAGSRDICVQEAKMEAAECLSQHHSSPPIPYLPGVCGVKKHLPVSPVIFA
jgi:hypothetical protein